MAKTDNKNYIDWLNVGLWKTNPMNGKKTYYYGTAKDDDGFQYRFYLFDNSENRKENSKRPNLNLVIKMAEVSENNSTNIEDDIIPF